MDIGLEILSDLTVFSKYAKHIKKLNRRETWNEIVDRYEKMMVDKYPQLAEDIVSKAQYIRDKKVLPSMRSLQFAGRAAEVSPNRIYNCAYLPIDSIYSFSETMFLLLGGSGVGFSVQQHHVEKLPIIIKPTKSRRYLIADSIEGWADSVKMLFKAYFIGGSLPIFDFRGIRDKGTPLVTAGGKAPGPEPLKECLFQIQKILDRKKDGEKLTDLECHDIECHIANAVLAGGIRRAALISLFSHFSEAMITCKYGNWWELNEQRGRSNNSAVLKRGEITEEEFISLWARIEASGSGEPGIYWTNDLDWGTNPCCFTGDTKILTPTGYREIKHLTGETELLNKNGEICNSLVWSNGVKNVVELTLSNKTKIKCTEDHRLMLNSGEEIQAKNAKKLRLMPYFVMNEEISEYTKYGFIQGDGACSRLSSKDHKGLELNIGKDDADIFELFGITPEIEKISYYTTGYNEILRALQFSQETLITRSLPNNFISWDRKDQLMFFKGMFSANGGVIKTGRVSYKTVSKKLAEQIVEFLEYFGISSYITTNKEKEIQFSNGNYVCRESYDVNIASLKSIIIFAEKIGFVHKYKKEALNQIILNKAPLVITIKNVGEEEVFDFSLDDNTHWGVVEGIIAHNCEIALRPFQFCNLCEVNVDDIESQADLNDRVSTAAFFGTLQAGFTDFHYLRPIWKKTTEKDALLGIGMTGIGSGKVLEYDLEEASNLAILTNKLYSERIGINEAARVTCVKPAGTTSCVLGCSSGIHAWHNDYYLRTVRYNKNEDLASYLIVNHPEIVEDDILRPQDTICVRIPIKAPSGSILRTETALDTLERVKKFATEWVKPGHLDGANSHNVSATISIDKTRTYIKLNEGENMYYGTNYHHIDEWGKVGEWMWENKEYYNGLSVLPYFGGSYVQAPFQDITKEEYEKAVKNIQNIDLTKVMELDDTVNFGQAVACGGGACEII